MTPLDWTVISIIYRGIIEQASSLSAKDWSNYGCPNPILSAIVENGLSVACHSKEQARSKVSRWVDGITCLHAERCPKTNEQNKQGKW